MNLIEWSVFKLMVSKHQYWSKFPAARGPKSGEHEQIVSEDSISQFKQRGGLGDSIPDNGWKPSIAAIFRSPQDRNLANSAS